MDYLRTNYKKVLKILGVFLVLFGFLFVVAYFLDNNSDVKEFEITNLTSNSVTLSWVSDKSYVASVQYSDADNWPVLLDKILPKTQAFDDRDLVLDNNNNPVYSDVKAFPRTTHHITIRNLEAGKQYFFRINGYDRTYVPSTNTATTLGQSDKVAEPDPVYGKVINYQADGDNPTDGIVYYDVTNANSENDTSAKYSSTIGRDSGWSGDLSNIMSQNGTPYKWDTENFKIEVESKTPEGYGFNSLSLAEYKPLEDAIVNLRYIENASVLGLSTDSSEVLGISTVEKVSAGSAIENGVPVCKSPYSESCGNNCSRDITCQGNAFRAGPCGCKADTSTPKTQTSTKVATCPVATIWDGSKCAATGVGTKLDITKSTDPSLGGGDKVADKPGKVNDPKTRAEANKVVPAGTKAKSSGGATKPIDTSLEACKKDPLKVFVNAHPTIGTLSCKACGQGDGRKATGEDKKTYICNDPSVGWVAEDADNTCPSNPVCPAITCNGAPNSFAGKFESKDNGIVRCSYEGTTIPVGICSNNSLQISATLQNNPDVCGIPNTNLCAGKLDDIRCPPVPNCGDGSKVTSSLGLGADYVYCSYQSGDASTGGLVATCAKGVVTPINYNPNAICNSTNSKTKNQNIPLVSEADKTPVISQCNTAAENLHLCNYDPANGTECISSTNQTVYCNNAAIPQTNDAQNSCLNSILGVSCPSPSNCQAGVSLRGSPTSSQDGDSVNCHYTFNYAPPGGGATSSSDFTLQMARCTNGVKEDFHRTSFTCPSPSGGNGNIFSPVKKVYAQPIPDIIDPTELSKGTYRIVVPGYKNAEFAILNNKVAIKYFDDKNSDGIKQASEAYIDPKTFTVTVSKLSDLSTYTINTGWNLIALNFVSSDFSKASNLIKEMNNQGIGAVQISKYDNGNWVHLVYRINDQGESEVFGNDFNLVPGEGYFVRSLGNGVVSLKGQKFTSSVPINLNLGWNLASIQSLTSYTANSFLTKCVSQGANCTTISRFDSGVYDSVVNFENKFFGNNFDIQDTEGYFVLNKSTNKTISP